MRAGMNPRWLMNGDVLVGITLGADFTAEHEWGIDDLKRLLGVDGAKAFGETEMKYTKPPGLPRRMVSKHDTVRLVKSGKASALLCCRRWWYEQFDKHVAELGIERAFKEHLPQDLKFGRDPLRAAWSGEDFGVYGEGEDADKVGELAAAFEHDDIARFIGGGAFAFENGGLVLVIASRVPPCDAKILEEGDLNLEKLKAASDATRIHRRLKEADRGYFACSPRWKGDLKKKTEHPVIYWLNPMEQDQYNAGWYTVEELDQWIAGTGPVMKTAGAKR